MTKKDDILNKYWLLQTYDDGTFYVYEWTPILALKPNMRPIAGEEAGKYLELVRKGNNHVKFLSGKAREIVDESVKVAVQLAEDESITEKLMEENAKKAKENAEKEKTEEAPKLNYTQGDILEMEVAFLTETKTRGDIEQHMLKKYQVELPPAEKIGDMRQAATTFLEKLAKDDRLYLIDGRV